MAKKSEPKALVTIAVQRDNKGKIWSHIRKMWLIETPEETVRQDYLCILVNEYGFKIEQMDEELEPVRKFVFGSGSCFTVSPTRLAWR